MFTFCDAFDQHVKKTWFELEFNKSIAAFIYGKRKSSYLFFAYNLWSPAEGFCLEILKLSITAVKILCYSDTTK